MAAEPEASGSPPGKGPSPKVIALGLAAVHAVLGLLLFEPTLFPGGDNAGYLILGDALRSGEGYRDLYLPGAPLHAKYPPLLPLIAAVLGSVGATKLGMLACTTLAVWITARFGRSWVGARPAVFAAASLALSPTLLEYGHYVLAEAPFVVLILASLWACTREDRLGVGLAIAAAVGAFATRTAGLTILLALPIAWGLQRRFKPAAIAGAAAVLTMGLWALYQGRAAPAQPSYLEELVLRDPYTPTAGSVGLAGLVVRAASNLWTYVSRVVSETAVGPGMVAGGLALALGVLVLAPALGGWADRARKSLSPAVVFVLLYVGLIAVWPEVWTDRRFLLPVFPLLLLLAFGFLEEREAIRRWAPYVLVLALVIPSGLWAARTVPDRMACRAEFRAGRPCDPPALASFFEAARWIRDNTPPDAIVANRKPRLFYWVARREGDLYPYTPEPAQVMSGLERMGADFVIVDQISATTGRYLIPAIQAFPDRFEPLYRGGNPESFVFGVRSPSVAAE